MDNKQLCKNKEIAYRVMIKLGKYLCKVSKSKIHNDILFLLNVK
jgi:hypothetical protein